MKVKDFYFHLKHYTNFFKNKNYFNREQKRQDMCHSLKTIVTYEKLIATVQKIQFNGKKKNEKGNFVQYRIKISYSTNNEMGRSLGLKCLQAS